MKIQIWFKYTDQDANNPGNAGMFHMRQFDFATDAYRWLVQNEDNFCDVIITKQIRLLVDAYNV
jgi:hypothetical protein